MKHLLFLTPSPELHSLAENYLGDQANCLLSHWTALWHPLLIHLCQSTPGWQNADASTEKLGNAVISISPSIANREPAVAQWLENTDGRPVTHIHGNDGRQQLAENALSQFPGVEETNIDVSVIEDFFALGYWYLQIELLTQQMHYTSNLDKTSFEKNLLLAANAATTGETESVRQYLQSCFGALSEVRDHYYPVDVFLLHITLITTGCSNASILEELDCSVASNLMISPNELDHRAFGNDAWTAGIQKRINEERASIIGCDEAAESFLDLDCQAQLAALESGLAVYENHFGIRPEVFGRYDLALSPRLPDLLGKSGYRACLHWALDNGRFPTTSQSRFLWRGNGGATIDAIGSPQHDASSPTTFLQLAKHLGKSMESDYVATVTLVNWAENKCVWLDDLRRGAVYSKALGEFTTLNDYFQRTDAYGQSEQFSACQYGRPGRWPTSASSPLLSGKVEHWKSRVDELSANHLSFMTECLETERRYTKTDNKTPVFDTVVDEFAHYISEGSTQQQQGSLVINPFSFPRRVNVPLNHPVATDGTQQVLYAHENHEDGATAIIDVPAAGFSWIPAAEQADGRRPRVSKKLVDGLTLRNEFLQLSIDSETGGIRSIRDYQFRGNCLSQQLAIFLAIDPTKGSANACRARADSVQATVNSELCGEITSQGTFVDQEDCQVAAFEQKTRLWRGARVVELEIVVSLITQPPHTPIPGELVSQFAWANETAKMFRGAIMTRTQAKRRLVEAPLYVEMVDGMNRIAILGGGLHLHRRRGNRMLETLLSSPLHSQNSFRCGIGINVKQPLHDAMSMCGIAPSIRVTTKPSQNHGWLFSFSTRRVTATSWELDREEVDGIDKGIGFRVKVLESSGQSGPVCLSAFRPIRNACKIGFGGKVLSECEVHEGVVHYPMAANEWTELQCRW